MMRIVAGFLVVAFLVAGASLVRAQEGESYSVDQMEFSGDKEILSLGESMTFTFRNDELPAQVNGWCHVYQGSYPNIGERMAWVFCENEKTETVPVGGSKRYVWNPMQDDPDEKWAPGQYTVELEGWLPDLGSFDLAFEFWIVPRAPARCIFRMTKARVKAGDMPWAYVLNASKSDKYVWDKYREYGVERKQGSYFREIRYNGPADVVRDAEQETLSPGDRRLFACWLGPNRSFTPGEYRMRISMGKKAAVTRFQPWRAQFTIVP